MISSWAGSQYQMCWFYVELMLAFLLAWLECCSLFAESTYDVMIMVLWIGSIWIFRIGMGWAELGLL